MKLIFLCIELNCKITFLLRTEFSSAWRIFTLQAPIFTLITKVWPPANQAVVTNNLTVIIEVVLINVIVFLYS